MNSKQDDYYLNTEGNNFFKRNFEDTQAQELRPSKRLIANHIANSHIEFERVLEFGCNYGDLLHHYREQGKYCYGIEASSNAAKHGMSLYENSFEIEHGTICENALNTAAQQSSDDTEGFDLIVIDDVFGWVSRETILQSIANIDALVNDGGYVFIRDFYPDKRVKNRNHHVTDADIYNFKVPGSHASIFLSTGTYEVHWQTTYFDNIGMSTDYKCDNAFNYRWTDIILKKSHRDYFDESLKLT